MLTDPRPLPALCRLLPVRVRAADVRADHVPVAEDVKGGVMKKLLCFPIKRYPSLTLALALAGVMALIASTAAYSADATGTAPTSSSSNNPVPSNGRDVFGNLIGTDVQGNPNDKNAQGNRPKDVQGNPPKDIYGNKIGSENK